MKSVRLVPHVGPYWLAGSTRQQPLVRIDLRESSVMEGPVGNADLGNIGEDAETEESSIMNHQAAMPHKLAGADANGGAP